MSVRFEEVSIKAKRRYRGTDGKVHQETKKFWQTISPFNRDANGCPKTREQILSEIKAERDEWLHQ